MADSRRKLDPYLVFLLAWLVILVGGVVLILTGAAAVAWHVLVQLATHPVITDNAIGAAITITGLAVIRHLRTRPREK
jgi:Zn-dependent membrane protease YugP